MKVMSIIMVMVMLVLFAASGCSIGPLIAGNGATTAAPGEPGDWDAAVIRAELKKLPRNYQPEKAVEDGCFVILHGKLQSDPKLADDFAAAAKAGQATSLRIVQYTIEGDPIIMHVDFRDGVFHALYDHSRDQFGGFGSDPVEYTLSHLAVFDEADKQIAYLVEEDDLSLADITARINQNQDPNGPSDLVMLYQYGKG